MWIAAAWGYELPVQLACLTMFAWVCIPLPGWNRTTHPHPRRLPVCSCSGWSTHTHTPCAPAPPAPLPLQCGWYATHRSYVNIMSTSATRNLTVIYMRQTELVVSWVGGQLAAQSGFPAALCVWD